MNNSMVKLGLATIVSLFGGSVGAWLVIRGAEVQHVLDWGTVIAATVAAVGTYFVTDLLGLRDHTRRQSRDELSRRFVDEGFDRIGRELAAAADAVQANRTQVRAALWAAHFSRWDVVTSRLATLQQINLAAIDFEAARISSVMASEPLTEAFSAALADLTAARIFFMVQVPSLLSEAAKVDAVESRKVIDRMLDELAGFEPSDRDVVAALNHCLASLSIAFQEGSAASVSEARQLRKTNSAFDSVVEDTEVWLRAALATRRKWLDEQKNSANG